jgi:hypothetical protein
MDGKFSGVTVENDTKILLRKEAKLGKYDVLYEKWSWDGIYAESIIFDNKDVDGLNEEELKKEVRVSPLVKPDSSFTIKKLESGFTFVNFNFEIK